MAETHKFPEISFDWLGNLPADMEAARITALRKNLGEGSLDEQAQRLISRGDIEGGYKLQALANQRYATSQRNAEAELNRQMLQEYFKSKAGAGGAPPPSVDPLGTYEPSAAPPAAAAPAMPTWPGPRSEAAPAPDIPPPPQTAQAPEVTPPEPPPGQISTALAPPPSLPVSRVAGPSMVQSPNVPAPAPPEPPAPSPLGVPPGFDPRFSPAPPTAPVVAPPVPRPGVAPGPEIAGRNALRAETDALYWDAMRLGDAAPKVLLDKLHNNLNQLNVTGETRDRITENLYRARQGLAPLSPTDYKQEITAQGPRLAEAIKVADTHRQRGESAKQMEGTLNIMSAIAADPNFFSGAGAPAVHRALGYVGTAMNLVDRIAGPDATNSILSGLGLDRSKINNSLTTVQLGQVFEGLAHSAVISKLGGLGNQVSNTDLRYTNAAFPSLLTLPGANRLLIEIFQAEAKQATGLANKITAYRLDRGSKITAEQIDKISNDYRNQNPLFQYEDGTKTDLAKKIDKAIEDAKKAPPPPPAAAPPPQRGPVANYLDSLLKF